MAHKPEFLNYVSAAFNARPFGMFVAPNWIGLAAIGLLGITNPGFWVLGAGLELGYLLTLATNPRFQRAVASRPLSAARAEWNERIARLLGRLEQEDRGRYAGLAERCASIIELQTHGGADTPHGRVILTAPPSTWNRIAIDPALPAALVPQMGSNVKFLMGLNSPF